MNRLSHLKYVIMSCAVLGLLAACGYAPASTPALSEAEQQTAVMSTVSVVLTREAFETMVAQATEFDGPFAGNNPVPSATPDLINSTLNPPTATPWSLTNTPVIPFTSTPVPIPCNRASFVKDITVPDGTGFASGEKFTKTWQLKNTGSCTWTGAYAVVFSDGSAMSAPAAVSLSGEVKPGGTIDISVDLVAPQETGTYKANWMLRDAQGTRFGLGDKGEKPFWVSINVAGFESDDVPASIYPYDFTASICQARWVGSDGDASVPCAGIDQGKSQWAAVQMKPKLEGGRQEDERAIWVHVPEKGDWLQGFYPGVAIQSGQDFNAWVGCLDGNESCKVEFTLDYKVDGGAIQNLGHWSETYDGNYTHITIDLDQFAGKKVEFILGIGNNGDSSLDAFWLVPAVK